MEKIKHQLINAIDDTYINYYLSKGKSNKASSYTPLQSYQGLNIQLNTNRQYIRKYYLKNASIKYLSIIKLHMSISFALTKSPVIADNAIKDYIKYRLKMNRIQLKSAQREEFKKYKANYNKESIDRMIINNKTHTRNKSSTLPKITKQSIVNYTNHKSLINSNTNLHNTLSLGLSSLPVYRYYSKVFSAFVLNKYGKLLKSNGNLKEIENQSIFRKYLIETKKSMIKKEAKCKINLKRISSYTKLQPQSQSKNILTTRSGSENKTKSKQISKGSNYLSQNNMSNYINFTIIEKRNSSININNVDSDTTTRKSPEKIKTIRRINLNDNSVLDYSDKCVGNDNSNINDKLQTKNQNINNESNFPSCRIKLYDVIFKYKNNFPSLNKLKQSSINSNQHKIKEVYIRNTNSHQVYYKSNDGRIYLPKIKIIEKRNALKEKEAYYVSKLENVFIKKCVLNNSKID